VSDQDNILPFDADGGKKQQLSEDKLMAYLEGKLPPAEQREVEKWLSDEGMESDALEGLHTLNAEEAKHSVARLNHKLRHSVLNKKRTRRSLKPDQFSWVAILIILLLVVLAYIVIRKAI
jgi:anti-sigma factor RsiW